MDDLAVKSQFPDILPPISLVTRLHVAPRRPMMDNTVLRETAISFGPQRNDVHLYAFCLFIKKALCGKRGREREREGERERVK